MFKTIVRKEILENIFGLRFHIVMLFSSLLVIFSGSSRISVITVG